MLRSGRIGGPAAVVCLAVPWLSSIGCSRNPVHAASNDRAAVVSIHAESAAMNVRGRRIVRATGIVQAVRTHTVRVPQLSQIAQVAGRGPQLTLTALIPNGTAVKQGDTLVEFDRTAQLDDARDAQAKLEDLQHQVAQTRAQVNSDSTKRIALIREAEQTSARPSCSSRKVRCWPTSTAKRMKSRRRVPSKGSLV